MNFSVFSDPKFPWLSTLFVILLLSFGLAAGHFVIGWLARRFQTVDEISRNSLQVFLIREKKLLHYFLWVSVVFGMGWYFVEVWGPYFPAASTALNLVVEKAGGLLLTIIGGLLFVRFLDLVVKEGVERLVDLSLKQLGDFSANRADLRKETLCGVAHYIVMAGGYGILVLVVLAGLGLDMRPILATAGVASLAVGFGAQSLVKDIISGFFILLEDQYAKGDTVNLDGEGGEVETLNLRITQLRNVEGVLITKSNGSINVVKNLTKDWSRVDFKIGVAYDSDLKKVMSILFEEARKLKGQYPDKVVEDPELLGVDEFGASEVIVRMWLKTVPGEQWRIKRAFNLQVKERFDRDGIEIPFPQRTVWVKSTSQVSRDVAVHPQSL